MSHKQNFTHRIVPRLRYHTRLHTMLPPCYSQLVLCTVIHSPCVPHYTNGSWFYAIVFFNHVHNPMDHDTNIMRSKLLLCSWFMHLYTQKNVTQATFHKLDCTQAKISHTLTHNASTLLLAVGLMHGNTLPMRSTLH